MSRSLFIYITPFDQPSTRLGCNALFRPLVLPPSFGFGPYKTTPNQGILTQSLTRFPVQDNPPNSPDLNTLPASESILFGHRCIVFLNPVSFVKSAEYTFRRLRGSCVSDVWVFQPCTPSRWLPAAAYGNNTQEKRNVGKHHKHTQGQVQWR